MEKIAKEYLKLYRDPAVTEYLYIYEGMDEYLQAQKEMYWKLHEKAMEAEKQIDPFGYKSLMRNPYLTGLYLAFQERDYEMLHNAIYHNSKHELSKFSSGGYDHSGNFWKVLDAMASNHVDVVEACFPEELGLCKNGYPPFVKTSNLLMALWYQNDDWLGAAYTEGTKLLGQKKGLWEKAIMEFLLALADQDADRASEALGKVCKTSRRVDRPKLYKILCTEAHGLYHIARHLLPEELFNRIEMPDNPNFCEGLVKWQEEQGYPEMGALIVHYPGELGFMNRILNLPVQRCVLEGSGKRQTVDVKEMKKRALATLQLGTTQAARRDARDH
ncbi:hypothetical protein AV656_09830 [Bhargavaea cecembensis]|uniref:Uncharacterized protein n=1 Tax=Bhargavaea cecembensis TaxID=394098 RepID=A0A163F2S5_9BACL|nr:hypothetical protein [Bhargavaea cecembensis]KZE37816.1 hypothetical protein AV656_09830 [Bhargavaea cecembensis]